LTTSDLKILVSCRICGGEFSKETLTLKDSPLANELAFSRDDAFKAEKFPLQVVMCSICKHFQLKHIVNPDRLFSNYIYKSGTSNFFREHFKSLANFISNTKELDQLKVVEIGSNDGILLDELKSLGINCVGVEPSKQLTEECLARGLDVVHGFLNEELVKDLIASRGQFDLVVGNNVFAHIDDLLGAFKCANQLLKTEGIFIFEVADFSKIREKGIFDSIYHEHMSFHTVTGLGILAKLSDFAIEKFTYLESHGGSFRFFLKKGVGMGISPRIVEQIEKETSAGLDSPMILSQLQEDIARRRLAVRDFIKKRDKRRLLVGYGAPAKAVTFISEMELENAGITAILDDNLAKQGKYLPSSGIPITSKEDLIDNLRKSKKDGDPIDFMIFPWNLGTELVSKLKAWAPNQSRAIAFFPDLQIVYL